MWGVPYIDVDDELGALLKQLFSFTNIREPYAL